VHVVQMTNLNLSLSTCKLSCTLKLYTPHQMSSSGRPSEIECNLSLVPLLDCYLLCSTVESCPEVFHQVAPVQRQRYTGSVLMQSRLFIVGTMR